MKVFYLLKNGEITEGEAPSCVLEDWDKILTEIGGVKVLAIATARDAIDNVRKAIFADEESLIGIPGKVKEGLTPVEDGYLKERGYCPV
jgi:hypothetical protein